MLQGSESDCAGAKVKLSENAKAAKAARAGRKREGWHPRVLVPKFAQSLQWTITKAHRSLGMFTWSEPLGTECLSPMLSLEPLKTRQCYLKPLCLQPFALHFWLERFSFFFLFSFFPCQLASLKPLRFVGDCSAKSVFLVYPSEGL